MFPPKSPGSVAGGAPALRRLVAVPLVAACVLAGCSQHARVICEPLALASDGDFPAAVTALDGTKTAESGNDRFLYHAQRGQLLHLAGDCEASSRELEAAVAVADALEPWSVTGTLTDYIVNEAVKAYAGEDYERAYLHYYVALNYLAADDLEGALIECRRLDEVLRKLDARYEEGTGCYQDDGFIRYLSGLIYESLGKTNDAFIDYKLAVRAYEGETGAATGVGVPGGLLKSLVCRGRELGMEDQVTALVGPLDLVCGSVTGGPPGKGSSLTPASDRRSAEIVVLIDSGWAPYKEEESIEVPIHRALVPEELRGRTNLAALVKIAYPVFLSVPEGSGDFRAGVSESGDARPIATAWAERVQDVDALARWTLDRRIGAIKFRSTLRATAKQVALMRAKHEREEKREKGSDKQPFASPHDENAGFWRTVLGWLVEDLATVAVAQTEQADTRSWVFLPSSIWMARIPVEPGEYHVSVKPEGLGRISLGRVAVGPGEKAFRSCRVFGGPHPVRCDQPGRRERRRRR